MSDSLPSSCPQRHLPFFSNSRLLSFFLPILLILTSFRGGGDAERIASRAENFAGMQFRNDVIGYAQNFLGLPYHYAGISTKTGFDCSGFTSFVLKEFGVKVSSCSSTQSTQGDKLSLDQVLPGDLVFFGRRGRIQHVAMVVKNTLEGVYVVHSTCSRGIIVENISISKYWRPRILFARDVVTTQAESNCLF